MAVPLEFKHLTKVSDDDDDNVAAVISNDEGFADVRCAASELVKSFSDGPGYVDPSWSEPVGVLQKTAKRSEVVKRFVDGEWRKYVANDAGELVEQDIERLFSV